MRLELLTLSSALTVSSTLALAGCEPAGPSSAPPAAAQEAVAPPPRPTLSSPAGPELPFKPMTVQAGETEQARQQAEQSIRELDQRAASLGADIAGARQQADEAVRRAQPRPPEAPPATQRPSEGDDIHPDAAPAKAPASPPPPPPPGA